MLALENVHASYGQSRALHGVTLNVSSGEIVAILGRNGMGKTTILRSVMGLLRIVGGRVLFEGIEISRLQPYLIPRSGIAYVPQGRQIFPEFTVRENLFAGVLRGRPDPARLEWVFKLFPRLKERLGQMGASLSGGEQQMLAIGRALMPGPKLLLLDEPTEGLSPLMAETVRDAIGQINAAGVTILLVEQHPRDVVGIAHGINVIEKGVVRAHRTRVEFEMQPEQIDELLGIEPA
jgi:branched-chain amino acid transport system ATP-binding protein